MRVRQQTSLIMTKDLSKSEKIDAALDLLIRYGQVDGDHHKAWVIDQAVRILAGLDYEQTIKDACDGEDGPNTYEWDEGIAP